jgi:hypothetical protein
MKYINAVLKMCLAAIVIGAGCSHDTQVSGIQITNGNCLGKIYNHDGTAAKGAVVKLIPADYNPFVQSGDSLDSAYTDANGEFAFNATQSKFYNILAAQGSFLCLQDSIYIQTQSKTILDNDTLRESGMLSGNVRLKPGDDNRLAVILVLGTDIYTVPSDTSGNFTMPLLPKGTYTVQIFTTLPGYAVFDTKVSVQSGAGTPVSITLPSANAPSIAQFAATYDSVSMHAVLTWSMPDTSEIISYALYRQSARGHDTMFLVDKGVTSFSDDVVGFDGDSVSYQIAGIGINYKEGYRSATQPIVVCGIVYCIKKMDLTQIAAALPTIGYVNVFSDQENEIFLAGNKGIYKLDSNGIVRKDYRGPRTFRRNLQSDDAGHLYMSKNNDSVVIFDRDLNVLSEWPLRCETFEVTAEGTLYAFDSLLGSSTKITVYDSVFNVTKEFHVSDRSIYGAQRFGDTLVTNEFHYGTDYQYIHFYDASFTPLSAVKSVDSCPSAWSNPRFNTSIGGFFAARSGTFVYILGSSIFNDESALLVFTDSKGDLLGRIVVPESRSISFDSRGNLYFVAFKYTEAADMGDDNPIEMLYIYTMRQLLRKNVK